MNFRTDLEILTLEPQAGGMTIIEARAADGSTVVLMVRVVEPLAVGGHMALALTAAPTAASQAPAAASMRDRMQARLGSVAPAVSTPAPRLAITLNTPGATTQSTSATPGNASAPGSTSGPPQTPSVASDASSLLLSSILGTSPRGSVQVERDVDDEMDALFGARRKG